MTRKDAEKLLNRTASEQLNSTEKRSPFCEIFSAVQLELGPRTLLPETMIPVVREELRSLYSKPLPRFSKLSSHPVPPDTPYAAHCNYFPPNASQAKGACLPNFGRTDEAHTGTLGRRWSEGETTDQFRLHSNSGGSPLRFVNKPRVRYSNCHSIRNSVAVAGR